MRSKHELERGIGNMLHDLRISKGLSKSQIADKLYIDPHTWARYENGESTPSVADFIRFFETLSVSPLKYVLDFLYPETYTGLDESASTTELKETAIHFFETVANKRHLQILYYLMLGNHGSNPLAQLEMLCMVDHLPLQYRYVIAQTIESLYNIAESEGKLINAEQIMPNVDFFREGLEAGEKAAINGQNGYTTVCK